MRVVLCGSGYGASYIPALAERALGLELAAILSRGSERSRALAASCKVPQIHRLAELEAADLAIVAVPGPAGVALVHEALARGLHVLAEHPWEPEELAGALALAARVGRVLHVNAHWADIERVTSVIEACQLANSYGPPLYVSMIANPRTLYSCLDIVGRCLGAIDPFAIQHLGPQQPGPFALLSGFAAGAPLSLQCQRFTSRVDDGSACLVNHHVLVVYEHGQVSLAEAHGPASWCRETTSALSLARAGQHPPCWTPLVGAEPSSIEAVVHTQRAEANVRALARVAASAKHGRREASQGPAYLLGVARAWRRTIDALGPIATL